MEPDKIQRQLDAFLVDNRELELLDARLARFNLFSVLKIQKAEIRHSNVLAWLLTLGETHGLGNKLLRRSLSQLLMEKGVDVVLTPTRVQLMNLNDVEVDREWRNIDVYGTSSVVQDAVLEVTETLVDCEFVIRHGSGAWFLPKEMGEPSSPTVKLSAWGFLPREVPAMWWFNYWKKGGKLGLVLEVGPIADGDTRRDLLKAIRQKGFAVKDKAFKEGAKFTRILSKYLKLKSKEDGEVNYDPDYVKGVARSLWKDLSAEGAKITEVLKDFKSAGTS